MNINYKKILLLLFFSIFLLGCFRTPVQKEKYIIVKVPPLVDKSLTQEEKYWRFRHFLFPQESIPNPIPEGLPNDHSLLFVKLDNKGEISINMEPNGNIQNTNMLKQRLYKIFQHRREYEVYEVNSNKVVKAVGIQAPLSTKYRDLIKLISTIEESGADPIVLQIDKLPK